MSDFDVDKMCDHLEAVDEETASEILRALPPEDLEAVRDKMLRRVGEGRARLGLMLEAASELAADVGAFDARAGEADRGGDVFPPEWTAKAKGGG